METFKRLLAERNRLREELRKLRLIAYPPSVRPGERVTWWGENVTVREVTLVANKVAGGDDKLPVYLVRATFDQQPTERVPIKILDWIVRMREALGASGISIDDPALNSLYWYNSHQGTVQLEDVLDATDD